MSTIRSAGTGGVDDAARQASESPPMRTAARLGFVAKGLVYGLIGVLAFQVARGAPERADQKGALQKVSEQPFGAFVLWLMVVGFAGYAIWRFSEAAWGHRGETEDKKRLAKRVVSAVNGLIYVALGVLAFTIATSSGGSGSGQTELTAKLLDKPGGQTLVVVAGLVVIAVAVFLTWRGLTTDFEEDLDTSRMSRRTYDVVRRLGQVGYVARGVVFCLIGVFVIKAAVDHQPGKAQGFDVALKSVAHAPFGQFLLMVAAAGLICFGVYCFADARYRRL